MGRRDFNFDLYRLTVLDDESLFEFMGDFMRSDVEIVKVIKAACHAKWDKKQVARKATYLWGLRNFVELRSQVAGANCFMVSLIKATLERDGVVVTAETIQQGTSAANPPLAEVAHLIFYMKRHLVAVERKSTITEDEGWLAGFHGLLRPVSNSLKYRSNIILHPKPMKSDILKSFLSFDRLTRLRVQLLLPNPDLTRLTRKLFQELQEGGIRTYLADMRNPGGLSQKELTLPHAAAAMAEDGYKEGDVLLEGFRGGKRETIKTGKRPARGLVEGAKEFVDELGSLSTTVQGEMFTDAVLEEIERLSSDTKN